MSGLLGSSQWMYASGEAAPQQSLKFNDDESQYLSWTPASAGNRKTFTLSMWFKLGNLPSSDHYLFGTGVSGSATQSWIYFNSSNSNKLTFGIRVSSSNYQITIDPIYRDPSAWYHLTYSVDTTQSTAADRVKIYVNGSEVTDFVSSSYPPQNSDTSISDAVPQVLGANNAGSGSFFDGYLSDIHFIDGQALDADDFGETVDGYWKAKDYAGTYGTNGFHLTFEDDVVSEGFNTVTYRGTGATQSISELGFEPNLVWIKNRDTAYQHQVYDSVRGATKKLQPSNTNAETTDTTALTSFDSSGFTLGSNVGVNESGKKHVAWCWDAGTGSAASNTDGSITSSVKANTSYGFSVVSYTGTGANATVGHGLSSAPEMVIIKNRTDAETWVVGHDYLHADPWNDRCLHLDTAAAFDGSQNVWNATAPTSSVINIGGHNSVNGSGGDNMIAYCFHSVSGYSSFGSYSGTGASGNTVTCGFRPAFVMFKNADDAGTSWYIHDATRDPYPPSKKILFPNESSAEFNDTGNDGITFTATGFTVDTTRNEVNGSGDNIIYMAFADTREAAFWKDVSGQGNHWTPNNLDYRDSLIDSPANNFAVFNALNLPASAVLSEGNLKLTQTANDRAAAGNMAITSGKWYFEVRYTSGTNPETGLAPISQSYANSGAVGSTDKLLFITNSGGMRTPAWSTTDTTGVSAQTGTTILGFAVDADNGKMFISVNGTYINSGDPAAGTNPQGTFDADWLDQTGGGIVPFSGIYTGTSGEVKINFGQDSTFAGATTAGGNQDDNGIGDFKHPVPSGFLALATSNLPTPTIVDGSEHFNTVLYTGDGSNGQAITGVGHQPDWLWIKSRSGTAYHELHDSVRGAGTRLFSNDTAAESTVGTVSSFDSDGFTVSRNSAYDGTNQNGVSFVGWNWKAGGTAVSNTDGSTTSSVSANTDAGFSILTYTADLASGTVGHGLNSAPELVIGKPRNASGTNWYVMHTPASVVPANNVLNLDNTSAKFTPGVNHFDDTYPTDTVVSYGGYMGNTLSGDDKLMYCFHSVDGYSKVGSYTGNGSSDGTFVYTGFSPAWVMVKRTDSADNWCIWDIKRTDSNGGNVIDKHLRPDSSSAESDPGGSPAVQMDSVSNGFKLRESNGQVNASGGTYIYLAFAETPLKFATAR